MHTAPKKTFFTAVSPNGYGQKNNKKLRKIANIYIPYDLIRTFIGLSIPIPIELAASPEHTLAKYYICTVISSFTMLLQQSISPFMYEYLSRAGTEKRATEKIEELFKNLVKVESYG